MGTITSYNAITSLDFTNDVLPIVDVDDTTMSGAGTTKKVTISQLASPVVVSLTDAATIAVNASLGTDFRVTLGGNRTLGNPSNPVNGRRIIFQVAQDGTGSRTLAYGDDYLFSASLPAPTLSISAGYVDVLGFIYNASLSGWLFVAFVPGFNT